MKTVLSTLDDYKLINDNDLRKFEGGVIIKDFLLILEDGNDCKFELIPSLNSKASSTNIEKLCSIVSALIKESLISEIIFITGSGYTSLNVGNTLDWTIKSNLGKYLCFIVRLKKVSSI